MENAPGIILAILAVLGMWGGYNITAPSKKDKSTNKHRKG